MGDRRRFTLAEATATLLLAYKEDYIMRTDELILLTEKVRTLLDILKNVKPV